MRLLRERELPVRAFVRLTSRYGELENRGAEIFIGDLRQDKDIQKPVRVFNTLLAPTALEATLKR